MAEDSHVEFIDSKEGNQFTVRISRPLTATEAGGNTDLAVSSGKKAVSSDEKAVSEERHHWPIEIRQLAFIHVCKECLDEFSGIFIRQIIDSCSMLGEKQNGVSIFLHCLLLSVPLPLSFLLSFVLHH